MHKFIKQATALVTALTLTFTPVYAASLPEGDTGISMNVNGVRHVLNTPVINEDDCLLAGMYELVKLLDAQIVWQSSSQTATVTKGDAVLKFTLGKTEAVRNEEAITLPVAPFMVRDTVMVPIRAVSEALGAGVDWNGETKMVTIQTGAGELSVLDKITPVEAGNAVTMTYDAAVKRAIETNSNLKNLQNNLEYWEEARKDYRNDSILAWDKSNLAALASYDTYKAAVGGAVQLMRAEMAYNSQIQNYEFNEQILKDSSAYMLRNYLTNIAGYKRDIELLTESIAIGATNIQNLELKQSVGMVSDNEVKTAKQNYQQSLINLENLKISLANEKQALNSLLNYEASKEIIVDFQPTVKPVTENLQGYISDSIRNDPTIKIKEKAVTEAEYAIKTSEGVMEESKIEKNNNLYKAQQDVADAKINLEKAIRSAYNTITQLEENQRSLEIELAKARDSYNTAATSYDVGLVTIHEVNQLKLLVLQSEIALEKNTYRYDMLVFAFERPYLLASGA